MLRSREPAPRMPTGETRLASLEIEILGDNRVAFEPALRVYDVGVPAGTTTVTVRAQAMDAEARVTWYVPDGAGILASGIIGVGSGEVAVNLPPDGYSLYVGVFPAGGAVETYVMTFIPCSSDCSDDNDCTADVCDPANDACSNPDEVDGVACDFGGLPGMCIAGVCEEDVPCPVLTSVLATPLQANLGDEINVSAFGVGPIDYLWTATGGSFVDPTMPITAYRCEEPGQQDLKVTVSNETGSCTDEITVTVTCLGGA